MTEVPKENIPKSNAAALSSGAAAGFCVDLTLYPLDTIKTRLQSQQGFRAAGGFRRIYAGIPAIAIGSAPSAALFFLSYETTKRLLTRQAPHPTFAHMTAACFGELTACLIRVPTEVIKQRAQAAHGTSTWRLAGHLLATDGLPGFYRGYWSTVSRELPFSFIEFPLWELFKRIWSREQGKPVTPIQTAACGSVAGAIAAGLTTPLDLAKTRIMLTRKVTGERMTVRSVLSEVYRMHGFKGLFAGFWPRTIWMSLGGFVFFGSYDTAVHFFNGIMAPAMASEDHVHILAIGYHLRNFLLKMADLFVGEEKAQTQRTRTFEDSVRDADKDEEIRLAFYAAAKRKFEGREQL